jgi:hypothetical protein
MPRRNSDSESYEDDEDEERQSDDEYRLDEDDEDDEDARRHKRARGGDAPPTTAAPSRPAPAVHVSDAPVDDTGGVDVSKLVVPRNPFAEATLKWAAYQVLSLAGADGLRAEEILARVRALGLGDLTSSKTPEASIIGATAYDPQFCRTAPKRYALAFLHYGGRIPPYNERKPMMGRPPGRSAGQRVGSGGRGRRSGEEERFNSTPGDRPYGGGFGGFISSTRPRREAAQRAVAGMASHLAAEGYSPGCERDGGPEAQQQAQQLSLAPLRRAVPPAPLQPFPPMSGRQVLTGMNGPLASVDAPVPHGVYVLRSSGFERQPGGEGGTSPAFVPGLIHPRFALCWYDAWNGLLHARAGHTTGAVTLNGTPLEPFTEMTLRPGHSLAFSGVDYWRGETLPAELLARLPTNRGQAAGGAPPPPQAPQAPVDRTYRPAPGGWGNFYASEAAVAADSRPVALTPGGKAPDTGGSHRGYYLSPGAGLGGGGDSLTQNQLDMAAGVDAHVLQLLAAPIPAGFTVRSWREDTRAIDGQRRQFLYMLCDPAHPGCEVLAIVGVETTRYHPKFTITQPGLTLASIPPPSTTTKRRKDVTSFLDSCMNRVCVEGVQAGRFQGADLGMGGASGEEEDEGSDSDPGSD